MDGTPRVSRLSSGLHTHTLAHVCTHALVYIQCTQKEWSCSHRHKKSLHPPLSLQPVPDDWNSILDRHIFGLRNHAENFFGER